MKVLLVEPYGTRTGHFGLYAANIGQELAQLGHQVVVLIGTRLLVQQFLKTKPLFRLIEVGLQDGVLSSEESRVSRRFKKIMHGPSVIRISVAAVCRAVQECEDNRFDIVHLLALEPISTALILLWNRSILGRNLPPLVVQVFPPDFTLRAGGQNLFRGFYKLASAFALKTIIQRYCRAVSVQGEWHRTLLMKQLACAEPDSPPFVVVRPGTVLPENKPSMEEARQALQLDCDATVFLFFGMLRKDKGIELLFRAVAGLEGKWQLVIAGPSHDWTEPALLEQISRLGIVDKVLLNVRYIPEAEVQTYFAAADALVLPYSGNNYRGNYGPMFLGCGHAKPLIVSDVGEMGCLVRRWNLGYAVVPDDVAALRRGLQRFIQLPPEVRGKMSANSQKLGEECSFANMAKLLSSTYSPCSPQLLPEHVRT